MFVGHILSPINLENEVIDRLLKNIQEVCQQSVRQPIEIQIKEVGNPKNRPKE